MLFGCATAFSMSYFKQANHYKATPHLGFTKFCPAPHITGREWIERLLQQVDQRKNGTSAHRKQFNEFFSSLHMRTLQFLVKTVGALHSLSLLKSLQHDSKYQQAVSELKEQIKQLAKPQRIGKLQMTGTALTELQSPQSWLKPMIYRYTTQNITSINIQYFFIILCIRPYLKIMQHIFVIRKN